MNNITKIKNILVHFAFRPRAVARSFKNNKDSWKNYLIPLKKKSENISENIDQFLYTIN